MTGFEVDPRALRAAADAAKQAAAVVRELKLGRVAELAAALPARSPPGPPASSGPTRRPPPTSGPRGADSYTDAPTAAEIDAELISALKRILSNEIGDAGSTTLAAAASAGEDRVIDERRHRELLEKYQVKTDGTTIWPTGLTEDVNDSAASGSSMR